VCVKTALISLMGMAMLMGCSDKHDGGIRTDGVKEVPLVIGSDMARGKG
jgi:hypothetical protein